MKTEQLLEQRETIYGDFDRVANMAQQLKSIIHDGETYLSLSGAQKEALDLIATKIARAVNGSPEYLDNWTDIAGYAKLAEISTEKRNRENA